MAQLLQFGQGSSISVLKQPHKKYIFTSNLMVTFTKTFRSKSTNENTNRRNCLSSVTSEY